MRYDQRGRFISTNREEVKIRDKRPIEFVKNEYLKQKYKREWRWMYLCKSHQGTHMYPPAYHQSVVLDTSLHIYTTDIAPMDYQAPAVQSVYDNFLSWKKSSLLISPTWSGKSFMMLMILQKIGLKSLIVAPKKVIAKQLMESFQEHSTANIKMITWSWPHEFDADIHICTQSTLNIIYDYINWSIDVLVVDECHNMPETRVEQYCMWKGWFILWVTATPLRKEFGIEWFTKVFGNVITVNKDKVWDRVLPCVVYKSKYHTDYTPDDWINANKWYKPWSPEILRRLVINNESRYDHLLFLVTKFRDRWMHNIIVFTDRTEHAEKIVAKLKEQYEDVHLYTGKTKREQFYEDYKWWIVVGNTSCTWEWFDLPMLEVGILFVSSSFKKSVIQYAWRVRRKHGEKKYGFFVDVQDSYTVWWSKRKTLSWSERNKTYLSEWRLIKDLYL